MKRTTQVTHVVHVNLPWTHASLELHQRRTRFDRSVFSTVRVHLGVNGLRRGEST